MGQRFSSAAPVQQPKPASELVSKASNTKFSRSLLLEKVQLVWSLTHTYKKLSFNIIRVICSEYLGVSLNLALFTSSTVYFRYDYLRREWLKAYPHNFKINGYLQEVSILYVGGNRLLLTALGPKADEIAILEDGKIDLMTKSHWSHRGAGVLHEPEIDCVFLFGGSNSPYCEQYMLRPDLWRQLPTMLLPQSCFTPCLFRGLIYLPGSNTIETYEPRTNRFNILKTLVMPRDCLYQSSACVVYQDSVVVLYANYIARLEDGGWRFTKTENAPGTFYSNCKPVVHDGKVFTVSVACNTIVELDLESFTMTRTADLCIPKLKGERK